LTSDVQTNSQKLLNCLSNVVNGIYSSDHTIAAICNLFGATSGCLWEVNKQSGQEVFFLTSTFNRPDLEELVRLKNVGRRRDYQIKYDIGKSLTVSTRIFRERTSVVGKLGATPFDDNWLKKEHTLGLCELGIKEIALIPIFSKKGPPIASLSLYSSHPFFIDKINFINDFSRYFSLLWENSHLKVDEVRLDKSLMRHEIVGDIIVVKTAIEKLESYLELVMADHLLVSSDLFLSDIRSKIASIEASLRDSGIFDRAYINRNNNTFSNLQNEINSTLQPLLSKIPRKILSLSNIYYPRKNIEIRINSNDLGHIVRNIFENALKYSAMGSSINVKIAEKDKTLEIIVSNISRKMDAQECNAIWGARVRGRDQAVSDIPGTGLGLFVVAELCKIYGFKYNFWQDQFSKKVDDLAWSKVSITFQKDRVR
jgi:hypothetical protein